jgi:hypothetical protein
MNNVMPEKIISIDNFTEDNLNEGYIVLTNKQSIKLLIDNQRSCCEEWGYFWTNENLKDFIGADLLDVKITDTALNSDIPDVYEGGVMFVNLETNKGTLQFVAYNSHNGYYGHYAKVVSEQLNHSERL